MSDISKNYFQPAFLICVFVLGIAAGGMSYAIKSFGIYLSKEPLPIKKSLSLLDETGLGPYSVASKEAIENPDIVRTLGTEEYIQWVLEDSRQSADSAVRNCFLFITYYELPDRVPHVPEECYSGAGNQKLASEALELTISNDGLESRVPVRHLVFGRTKAKNWLSGEKFPVFYFFRVNGEYGNSREDARIALNKNIRQKYSYFSKIEWNFFNYSGFGTKIYPEKDQAITASKEMLQVILHL